MFDLTNAFIQLLALVAAVCGMILLQTAWRLSARNWLLLANGWSLIFVSLLLWATTTAAEKGAAIGLVVWVLVALVFLTLIALRTAPRAAKPLKPRKAKDSKITPSEIGQRILIGLLLGPVAGLASLALCTGVFIGLQALRLEHSINLIIVSLALPLVWAILAYIAGYQLSLWRKALTVVAPGLLSLACIAVLA